MKRIVDISEVLLLLGLSSSNTEEERAVAQMSLVAAEGAVRRHLRYDPVQNTHTEYYPQADFRLPGRQGIWEVSDTQAYVRQLATEITNELQVRHVPIRSVTSLKIDYDGRSGTRAGSFGSGTAKTEGADFWPSYDGVDSSGNKVCTDGIIRSEGRWPDVAGSVQIVYVAGYSDQELHGGDSVIDASPIHEAVLDEAQRRFLKFKSRFKNRFAGFVGPLTGESLGDYSYTANTGEMTRLIGGADLLPETIHKLQQFMRYDWGVV